MGRHHAGCQKHSLLPLSSSLLLSRLQSLSPSHLLCLLLQTPPAKGVRTSYARRGSGADLIESMVCESRHVGMSFPICSTLSIRQGPALIGPPPLSLPERDLVPDLRPSAHSFSCLHTLPSPPFQKGHRRMHRNEQIQSLGMIMSEAPQSMQKIYIKSVCVCVQVRKHFSDASCIFRPA